MDQCESKVNKVEQITKQNTTIDDFFSIHTDKIEQLKLELNQKSTTSNQTTYIYRHVNLLSMTTNQIKFTGAEYENPMQFLRQSERHMELIGDNLSDADKINVRTFNGYFRGVVYNYSRQSRNIPAMCTTL